MILGVLAALDAALLDREVGRRRLRRLGF